MIYKRKARKPYRMTLEHRIQNSIIEALTLNRCSVIRINSGMFETKQGTFVRGAKAGTPDLIGYRWKDNNIFFIEVKTPTGVISKKQIAYHGDLMHHKVIHGVARSAEEALKIVNEGLIGYGYPDTDKKEWY